MFRSSHPEVFHKKGVLENVVLNYATLFKKKTPIQVFSYEFWEIFKKPFFVDHLGGDSEYVLGRDFVKFCCMCFCCGCFFVIVVVTATVDTFI